LLLVFIVTQEDGQRPAELLHLARSNSRARNPAISHNSALCFSFYHSEDMGLGSTGVRVPMRRQHSNYLGI
jgi:hypothetical protein